MKNNETKNGMNSLDGNSALIPSVLTEGRDYGRMSGCGKPILYKAGAEKLLAYLKLRIGSLDCVSSVTDIGKNFLDFTYKCSLKDSKGEVAGISEGSSNSFEECYSQSYAVKDVNLLSREQYREKLRSGEGRWMRRKERWIWTERTGKDSVITMKNFIQKTAQRRAFVGAVLMAAGLSDFFKQD